jgi:peptidyl-dipeptidase Dcp
MSGLPADNPFAAPSTLPFAFPPFDRIREEHIGPAFQAGMAQQRAEVEAIAADPSTPTFANTVEPLERSGAMLTRVGKVFDTLVSAASTPTLRALEAQLAPELAAHADALLLEPRLFARLSAVHAARDGLSLDAELDAEQVAVLDRHHRDRVRAGAGLDETGRDRLRALNEELSELEAAFRTALLDETNDLAVHVEDVARLAGLSAGEIAAAAAAAGARGTAGWLLPLVLPTGQPVLASLRDRALREQLHRAATTRGLRGNDTDTRALLTRTAAARAERAALLGYPTHADWVIADQTAGSADAVLAVLGPLAPTAAANARSEQRRLTAELHADGVDGELHPWDWAYYAERTRIGHAGSAAGGASAGGSLRDYLELDTVYRDGVFAAATGLYGLGFAERHDLTAHHRDARTFQVTDADGSPRGLFVLDPFARESKRGGAWMTNLVDQSRLLDTLPVVVNVLNIARPPDGQPVLLSFEEVITAFHEFGHALHGLLSDVTYPRLSGTSVPQDFVEFPSQVNEMWAYEPTLLTRYARHHRTGAPLPPAMAEDVLGARSRPQGHATAEMLAATLLDLAWHQLGAGQVPSPDDVEAFEAAALRAHELDLPAVPPRYRSTYFNHIFGGGYSARYYAYLWSEVLDADAVRWFGEHGGLTRENGDRFRREVLARGGTVDPAAAYRAVTGADPSTGPLLDRLGLRGPAA